MYLMAALLPEKRCLLCGIELEPGEKYLCSTCSAPAVHRALKELWAAATSLEPPEADPYLRVLQSIGSVLAVFKNTRTVYEVAQALIAHKARGKIAVADVMKEVKSRGIRQITGSIGLAVDLGVAELVREGPVAYLHVSSLPGSRLPSSAQLASEVLAGGLWARGLAALAEAAVRGEPSSGVGAAKAYPLGRGGIAVPRTANSLIVFLIDVGVRLEPSSSFDFTESEVVSFFMFRTSARQLWENVLPWLYNIADHKQTYFEVIDMEKGAWRVDRRIAAALRKLIS
ncbi:MAG: hypothetical protein DRN96_02450 [Thermoproteota archaeon]|nr:MAG: hypothetical protein DRN96_02450 [Candidatus Korarchaeota archaeon]